MSKATYIGLALCTILLAFSIFAAINFANVLIESKGILKTKPKSFGETFTNVFMALMAMLYLPHAILQLQMILISLIAFVLVINTSKEPISIKLAALSIVIGLIVGVFLIYVVIHALPHS